MKQTRMESVGDPVEVLLIPIYSNLMFQRHSVLLESNLGWAQVTPSSVADPGMQIDPDPAIKIDIVYTRITSI